MRVRVWSIEDLLDLCRCVNLKKIPFYRVSEITWKFYSGNEFRVNSVAGFDRYDDAEAEETPWKIN